MRDGYAVAGRDWMYTVRVPRPRDLRPRHSVVHQRDLLAAIGFEPPDPETDVTEMVESEAAASVARTLAQAGVDADTQPVVVVHVNAGNPFRRWPFECFARALSQLVQADPRRKVVVTSGPSEAEAAERGA